MNLMKKRSCRVVRHKAVNFILCHGSVSLSSICFSLVNIFQKIADFEKSISVLASPIYTSVLSGEIIDKSNEDELIFAHVVCFAQY